MSDPQRPGRPRTETLPPGAERFWGQFSETKAGRSRADDEPRPPEPEAGSEEGPHCLEWCPICRSADIVRATSPEAIGQVQAIQNEAVNVLKSFLAIYAERSGQAGGQAEHGGEPERAADARTHGGPEVRDISID
jgi:hypothetical protein